MSERLTYPPEALPSERSAFRRAVNDLARGWADNERKRLLDTAQRHLREFMAFGDLLSLYRATEARSTPPADAIEGAIKQAQAAGLVTLRESTAEKPEREPETQQSEPPPGAIGEPVFAMLSPENAAMARQLAEDNRLCESVVLNLALDALAGVFRMQMAASGQPLSSRDAISHLLHLADAQPLMLYGRGQPRSGGRGNGHVGPESEGA